MLKNPCWIRAQRMPRQQQSIKVLLLSLMLSGYLAYRKSSVLLCNRIAEHMPSSVCSAGAPIALSALSAFSSVMVRSTAVILPRSVTISTLRKTAASGKQRCSRTICTTAPARIVSLTKCTMLSQCHPQSCTALSDVDCAQADERRTCNVE